MEDYKAFPLNRAWYKYCKERREHLRKVVNITFFYCFLTVFMKPIKDIYKDVKFKLNLAIFERKCRLHSWSPLSSTKRKKVWLNTTKSTFPFLRQKCTLLHNLFVFSKFLEIKQTLLSVTKLKTCPQNLAVNSSQSNLGIEEDFRFFNENLNQNKLTSCWFCINIIT